MSSARDELYDLAESENGSEPSSSNNLTKDDVSSVVSDCLSQQQEQVKQAEQQERQRKIEEQRAREQQELSEVSAVVKKSLQDEMEKDKQFAEIVQTSDLPGGLIDYIAEVGEPEEAPLIIRELASSEEYKQKLKRAKTEVGVKRLLSQVRKAVLMGGQPQIPESLKKDIPNYNYNDSPSNHDKDYISSINVNYGI